MEKLLNNTTDAEVLLHACDQSPAVTFIIPLPIQEHRNSFHSIHNVLCREPNGRDSRPVSLVDPFTVYLLVNSRFPTNSDIVP